MALPDYQQRGCTNWSRLSSCFSLSTVAGGALKGSKPSAMGGLQPTESLRAVVTPREPIRRKQSPPLRPVASFAQHQNKVSVDVCSVVSFTYSSSPSFHQKKKSEASLPHPSSTSSSSANEPNISHLKGVDSKLAQALLDELLEKDTNITWNDIGITGALFSLIHYSILHHMDLGVGLSLFLPLGAGSGNETTVCGQSANVVKFRHSNAVGLELPKQTLQEIVILPAINPEVSRAQCDTCGVSSVVFV